MNNIFRWHSSVSGQRNELHRSTWWMWTSCIPSQWLSGVALLREWLRAGGPWGLLALEAAPVCHPTSDFPFLPAARARNTSQTPCYTVSGMDRLPCCKLPPGWRLVSWCSCISSEGRWAISRGCFSRRIWALAVAGRAHRRLSTAEAKHSFCSLTNTGR